MAEPPAGRPLLVCADDFGLAPGIAAAVAALVRAGRLGAFSCISNAPLWREAAIAVPGLRTRACAGLHLNLTEGRPLSAALAAHWPTLPCPSAARLNLPIQLFPLPTYASWTNPLEKLWRWLNQEVLSLQRLADDWAAVKQAVRHFLDPFAQGSLALLRSVGLSILVRLYHALFPR